MRAKVQVPDWLKPWDFTIVGFEKKEESSSEKDDGSEEDDDDDDDDSEKDDSKSGESGEGKEDTRGLKSALDKERRDRKRFEKELKALRKFKDDTESANDSEKDKAEKEATKAKEKNAKLATKLRENAIDTALIKLAGKHKFRDVDDALRLVNRESIDVEQDEDEPDDIEIDEKSVEKALKALATSKPHLVLADGEEDRSGSKFGGKKKGDEGTDDDALRNKYSALRRS